ncbi:MAG: PD40 domain-containing protein [Sphingobacteriia bacterium]|nr:PD40 domain-containing protein [Sphingobacteriia bacterium]
MKNLFLRGWLILFPVYLIVGTGCGKAQNIPQPNDTLNPPVHQPALMGRLIFHSYTCYTCNDAKIYLYDFATGKLSNLSDAWNITNPMNAHFSPDGKSIVFMGRQQGSGWDIFRWRIGSSGSPVNLTAQYGNQRNEDPKYAADGTRIVFKQNGRLKEADTLGNIVRSLEVPQAEASMPYYTKADSVILYSGMDASGKETDIFQVSLKTGFVKPLAAQPDIQEYYPIARDDTSYFYSRWYSASNRSDQVYLGFLNGRNPQRLLFNESGADFSDAYPVNSRFLILSSTVSGGKGGYDLFVADMVSGAKWSMNTYHLSVNSSGNELGACYTER